MNIFMECDTNEGTVEIGDNIYKVNPGDLTIACLWIPTAEVKIKKLNTNSIFNIEIINLENNEIIYAHKAN